jgi:hypothetical protein
LHIVYPDMISYLSRHREEFNEKEASWFLTKVPQTNK